MWSATLIGALSLTLSIWLIVRKKTGKKAVKIRVWAAVIAGLLLSTGAVAAFAGRLGAFMVNTGVKLSSWAFGTAIAACVVLVVLLEVWHAGGKGGTGGHRFVHPLLGFVAASVLIAAGGAFALSVGWIREAPQNLPELTAFFTAR